jgi:hypothetical protein
LFFMLVSFSGGGIDSLLPGRPLHRQDAGLPLGLRLLFLRRAIGSAAQDVPALPRARVLVAPPRPVDALASGALADAVDFHFDECLHQGIELPAELAVIVEDQLSAVVAHTAERLSDLIGVAGDLAKHPIRH